MSWLQTCNFFHRSKYANVPVITCDCTREKNLSRKSLSDRLGKLTVIVSICATVARRKIGERFTYSSIMKGLLQFNSAACNCNNARLLRIR